MSNQTYIALFWVVGWVVVLTIIKVFLSYSMHEFPSIGNELGNEFP